MQVTVAGKGNVQLKGRWFTRVERRATLIYIQELLRPFMESIYGAECCSATFGPTESRIVHLRSNSTTFKNTFKLTKSMGFIKIHSHDIK